MANSRFAARCLLVACVCVPAVGACGTAGAEGGGRAAVKVESGGGSGGARYEVRVGRTGAGYAPGSERFEGARGGGGPVVRDAGVTKPPTKPANPRPPRPPATKPPKPPVPKPPVLGSSVSKWSTLRLSGWEPQQSSAWVPACLSVPKSPDSQVGVEPVGVGGDVGGVGAGEGAAGGRSVVGPGSVVSGGSDAVSGGFGRRPVDVPAVDAGARLVVVPVVDGHAEFGGVGGSGDAAEPVRSVVGALRVGVPVGSTRWPIAGLVIGLAPALMMSVGSVALVVPGSGAGGRARRS